MATTLLVIDDEAAFLAIVRRTSESAGVAVKATTEPDVFKEAVRADLPTLVLLDLQMPDCDGVELLRFLAEAHSPAKIILMSGMDSRVLGLARGIGEELGLDMGEPLQKPIRPADLHALLLRFRGRTFQPDKEAISAALAGESLELYYQPLVELREGRTIGFEALARWNHPDFGIIMPDRFIGLAEREGLIGQLTDRVLSLAVKQLAGWRGEGFTPFISLNISAANVDAKLPDGLGQLCASQGVPASQICLELTETAAMGNPTLMLEVLTRLRLKGFKLAIDDFGTGYSSLLQLHRLPFSELKIDQSFVRKMGRSEEASLIVGAIVNLAHSLKLELIAEGIENQDLSNTLSALGCEMGQGYHFSRPMPAAQVLDWLAKTSG
jgi:EAL domain-containing protein (putative c-di-GMP-specific phosphodiesterase class I)/ActR/RegA family two-component response regulator